MCIYDANAKPIVLVHELESNRWRSRCRSALDSDPFLFMLSNIDATSFDTTTTLPLLAKKCLQKLSRVKSSTMTFSFHAATISVTGCCTDRFSDWLLPEPEDPIHRANRFIASWYPGNGCTFAAGPITADVETSNPIRTNSGGAFCTCHNLNVLLCRSIKCTSPWKWFFHCHHYTVCDVVLCTVLSKFDPLCQCM